MAIDIDRMPCGLLAPNPDMLGDIPLGAKHRRSKLHHYRHWLSGGLAVGPNILVTVQVSALPGLLSVPE